MKNTTHKCIYKLINDIKSFISKSDQCVKITYNANPLTKILTWSCDNTDKFWSIGLLDLKKSMKPDDFNLRKSIQTRAGHENLIKSFFISEQK